jgi:integrase
MGRGAERLTVKFVENQRKPGMYCDGRGLYLRVAAGGSRQWIFRYWAPDPGHPHGHRLRDMGLGSVADLSLVEARELARQQRLLRRDGHDPIGWRTARQAEHRAEAMKVKTFRQCAEQWLVDQTPRWSPRSAKIYARQLELYVYPRLGLLPIADVATPHVLEVVKPLWAAKKVVTGNQVLERIRGVLHWATVHKLREGTNPASWDVLKYVLPRAEEVKPKKHRASLPYQQLPDYYTRLLRDTSEELRPSNLCLRFVILTGVRVNEATGAKWDEVDLDGHTWKIPAERMKGSKTRKREHLVPLSSEAVAVLKEAEAFKRNDYVFPGDTREGCLSHGTILFFAKRLYDPAFKRHGYRNPGVYAKPGTIPITTHGFRSTFTVWAAEQTHFPREVREHALAHKVETEMSGSYQRSTLFQKRAQLMQAYADFITTTTAKVVQMPLRM